MLWTAFVSERLGLYALDVPTPLEVVGKDTSLVSRIRQDQSIDDNKGLALVVSGDNPREDAA